jgi:hypothetical protein
MHEVARHRRFTNDARFCKGRLTMTNRRLLFHGNQGGPNPPPTHVLDYASITKIKRRYRSGGMRLVKVTMSNGETWDIIVSRKSVKTMKKLVRRTGA